MPGLLRNIDLNLLVLFDILWEERSVSRAARHLHRSQSAVSLALERLRTTFDDPLFVWNGREMQPTLRGVALAPRIRAIVAQVNETLVVEPDDPRRVEREFTIATADYIDWLLGPRLMQGLETTAPNLTLYFVDVGADLIKPSRARETEMFIFPDQGLPAEHLSSSPLFRDRYVCVAAADNERVYEGMSVAEFVKLPQATYTAAAGTLASHETLHLAALGVEYRNRILTPHYMALPMIVSKSGGVAIMQERLARFMSNAVDLKLITPPVAYPELEINLYWDPSFDRDAIHRWLREQISAASAELPGLPERVAN